jgi:hypothetical protein
MKDKESLMKSLITLGRASEETKAQFVTVTVRDGSQQFRPEFGKACYLQAINGPLACDAV